MASICSSGASPVVRVVCRLSHTDCRFFESRHSPKTAPVTLWLNGGPGCSSMTGVLFENGPCRVADDGNNVTYNKHSWTSHSNMIFLDQPVNVGYSYSSDGSDVNNTPVAAEDVYAFLELFFATRGGELVPCSRAPFAFRDRPSSGGRSLPSLAPGQARIGCVLVVVAPQWHSIPAHYLRASSPQIPPQQASKTWTVF